MRGCWGSVAWEQVLPEQPRGAQLWSRARVLQPTCLSPGESRASPCATARSALMGGLALVGSLLPLGSPGAASTTQGAFVLCQGHLLPTSSAHHVRSWSTGSGRRVSGGLRRWSLGRGCSLAAPRTKPGGGRLRAPPTSLSGVPPHPPPKPSELLVGRLPRSQPPRWPRQLLHSCSQTLRASQGGSGSGLSRKCWCKEGVGGVGGTARARGTLSHVPLGSSTACSEGLVLGRVTPVTSPT